MMFFRRTKPVTVTVEPKMQPTPPEQWAFHSYQQQLRDESSALRWLCRQHQQQQMGLMFLQALLMIPMALSYTHSLLATLLCLIGLVCAFGQFALHQHEHERYQHQRHLYDQAHRHFESFLQQQQRQTGFKPYSASQSKQTYSFQTPVVIEHDAYWAAHFGYFSVIALILWVMLLISFIRVPWGLPIPTWLT